MRIPPPDFAWFDPVTAVYRQGTLEPATLMVGAALNAGGGGRDGFPKVFEEHPLDPLARPAEPWGLALAGLVLAVALVFARYSLRPPPDVAARAMQREWLRAVGLGQGAEFWRAAEEASTWLRARGRPVGPLRDQIAAARYGGDVVAPDRVRARLVEALGRAFPPTSGPLPLRLGAVALVLAASALCWLFAPHAGDPGAAGRASAADRSARSGDVDRARREWTELWREGSRHPALAARLAWGEVLTGDVGAASVWVLEGERTESRDPALGWVSDRVREGGGLIGATPLRLPVRRVEWGMLAGLLALAAGASWPRRRSALALIALVAVAATVSPIESWRARHLDRAVVRGPVALAGTGIGLEPGQVVRILSYANARVRVAAGAGVEGWVPGSAIYSLEELR